PSGSRQTRCSRAWRSDVCSSALVTLPVPPDCVAGAPAGWTTSTIQPGDTLSGLALRTGAMTEQLISANCITNPRGVAAGTVLAVERKSGAEGGRGAGASRGGVGV